MVAQILVNLDQKINLDLLELALKDMRWNTKLRAIKILKKISSEPYKTKNSIPINHIINLLAREINDPLNSLIVIGEQRRLYDYIWDTLWEIIVL